MMAVKIIKGGPVFSFIKKYCISECGSENGSKFSFPSLPPQYLKKNSPNMN